jgi:hypothetical protein
VISKVVMLLFSGKVHLLMLIAKKLINTFIDIQSYCYTFDLEYSDLCIKFFETLAVVKVSADMISVGHIHVIGRFFH